MLQQIKSYINFLYHSKNEHGVHSPFVFALVTKCFYDKPSKPEYSILKDYRKALLDNKNTIEVTDFGAGSRVFKSNTRAINRIAKNAGITQKRAELLLRITQYFQPENISNYSYQPSPTKPFGFLMIFIGRPKWKKPGKSSKTIQKSQ